MSRKLMVVPFTLVLAACSLSNTHLYGSEKLPASENAVISSLSLTGPVENGGVKVHVYAIDGQPVDQTRTASFLVPPGTYRISLRAMKDMKVTAVEILSKVAADTVTVSVQGGHTYIPRGETNGDGIAFYFEDKGVGYPTECLPLYEWVSSGANPGASVYGTKKKCDV